MKNGKLTVIISVVLAVVLLACAFIFKFERDVESGWTNLIRVELNEEFDSADVEKILKEAGAGDVIVQKQITLQSSTEYIARTRAVIYFEAENPTEVFTKAEELLGNKYFLKYEGVLYELSGTMTYASILNMWPLLIVLAAALAYVFIRFGVSSGVTAIVSTLAALCVSAGIISVTRTQVGTYSVPAFIAAAGVMLMFNIVFDLIKKENAKRISGKAAAFAASVKQMNVITVVLSAAAIAALALVLILGDVILKKFAITFIIVTAVNAVAALFLMPALAGASVKEK